MTPDGGGRGHRERAGSFGAAAASYERGRPPYPETAVDWLISPSARRVLDLGAGTGKLTRQLSARGLEVIAVEPSAGMRRQLMQAVPGVTALAGSAEAIPLPDHSVDAVVAAQAWHWVDPARAVPEVARVLRPAGALGLVWNVRDEREGWVAALGGMLRRHTGEEDPGPHPVVGAPFAPLERRDVAWEHRVTRESLLDLVASRSYVITLPADERAALLAEVGHLVDTHLAGAGGADLVMPYVTQCYRTFVDAGATPVSTTMSPAGAADP